MAALGRQTSILSVGAGLDMLDGLGKYPFETGDRKVLVACMDSWNFG